METFVKECEIAKEMFMELGMDKEKRMEKIWNKNLDYKKGYILKKFWMEKEKVKKEGKEILMIERRWDGKWRKGK